MSLLSNSGWLCMHYSGCCFVKAKGTLWIFFIRKQISDELWKSLWVQFWSSFCTKFSWLGQFWAWGQPEAPGRTPTNLRLPWWTPYKISKFSPNEAKNGQNCWKLSKNWTKMRQNYAKYSNYERHPQTFPNRLASGVLVRHPLFCSSELCTIQ